MTGGPDEQERTAPGSTETNPAGVSTPEPAEGGDDTPPQESGSPEG